MVNGGQIAIRQLLEHREVYNPHWCPLAGKHIEVVSYLDTQGAQGFIHDGSLISAEEDDIAIFRTYALHDGQRNVVTQEFHDWRLQAFGTLGQFVYLDVGQALGTVDTNKLGVVINLFTGQLGTLGHAKGGDTAFRIFGGTSEHLEVHAFHQITHILKFQRDTKVRLVAAVTLHGFRIRHARKLRQLNIQHILEQGTNHFLVQAHQGFFINERSLDVHLGKLGLTIGTQIFIAETLGNLVVAIYTRHHQQLFEQLRRLWQSEEGTFVGTARYQVVTGTFRGGTGQDRGFHIHESAAVQEVPDVTGHTGTEPQTVDHLRATQIYETVPQANILAHVDVLIQRERRGGGCVQNDQLFAQQLDLASGHVVVLGTRGATTNAAGHLDNKFAADFLRQSKTFRGVRIDHNLRHAIPISQIQKDDPTVVTAAVYPSAECDFLIDVRFVNPTAIMAAHIGSRSF